LLSGNRSADLLDERIVEPEPRRQMLGDSCVHMIQSEPILL
jgi:hypothetical protein